MTLSIVVAKLPEEMSVKEIKAPVNSVMQEFEKRFKSTMKSKTALLDKITHYIIKRKGKQMRPLFVFLSAGIFGEINDRTYTSATLIELLHTATLVHDDVVDESERRRGKLTAHAVFGNAASVLVGDFLYSRSFQMMIEIDSMRVMQILS